MLAAAGHFPKRLSKCTRPACATCSYEASRRKPWRTKVKHNKAMLESIRTLADGIAHTDITTSSVPGLIAQMVRFLTFKNSSILPSSLLTNQTTHLFIINNPLQLMKQ